MTLNMICIKFHVALFACEPIKWWWWWWWNKKRKNRNFGLL